jgi:hypothetical protein
MLGMMMTIDTVDHLDAHAEKARRFPFVDARLHQPGRGGDRKVCGVTRPGSFANRAAVLNAVFTDCTGTPFHSTK